MKYLFLSLFSICFLHAHQVFVENICDPFWKQKLSINEKIYEEKKDHEILIFSNDIFGRIIAIDGAVYLTEFEEPYYHEMLVHIPMASHPKPRRILVLGGGDGGALREILKHPSVEQVTVVESNQMLVECSKKLLPFIAKGAFEDPRAHLCTQDEMEFLDNSHKKYDVIICDAVSANSFKRGFYTEQFYSLCRKNLTSKGILVHFNVLPSQTDQAYLESFKHRSAHFSDSRMYVMVVPSENGGFLRGSNTFSFCSSCNDYKKVSRKELKKRALKLKGEMKYYNIDIHKGAFALPENIKLLTQNQPSNK